MKTIILACISLFISFSEIKTISEDEQPDILIVLDLQQIPKTRSIILESISAHQNNNTLSVIVESYFGIVSYLLRDENNNVVLSGSSYVNGTGELTSSLSLLDTGYYSLSVYTSYEYSGTLYHNEH